MKRSLLVLAVCVALIGFSAQAQAAYKKQVLNAATASPLIGPYGQIVEKFKTSLEEFSGGAITVKNLSGGALGDEQANVKQLRSQELHMSVLFAGNLTPFSPVVTVFNLPYLFPEIEDCFALFSDKEFMGKINDIVAKQAGVRPLGWSISSYRHLTNSKHRVKNINDLQGLKIRVSPAEVQLESFRSWGVDPHPLAWTETFNALQQGVVDGQENPYATNADQKFWEIQKYTTELHYMLWIGPVLVSETWYQKQDDATKEIINKAAEAAANYGTKILQELAQTAKQACLDHGMIIDVLEDEQVWIEKAQARWPKFYDSIGDKAIVNEAVAIVEKARAARKK